MENDQFAHLAYGFLQQYYEERGIENVESEALADIRQRAETVKESYKAARNMMIANTLPGPSRIHNNRKAAAAAKVRDEVYKKELAGDIYKFHEKCGMLEEKMKERQLQIDEIRLENEELREKLVWLQRRNDEVKEKDNVDVIVETLGATYEERRRKGFVCPSLFGDETDVLRYGGVLPKSSQD